MSTGQVHTVEWTVAEQIAQSSLVDESLRAFLDSGSADNATGLVSYIIAEYNRRRHEAATALFGDTAELQQFTNTSLGEPFDDTDPPFTLAQQRKEDPAFKAGRERMAEIVCDALRFRLLADLFIVITEETDEYKARMAAINEFVDAMPDDPTTTPGLTLVRNIVDGLHKAKLLKEPSNEQPASN